MIIWWLRRDLRLANNVALTRALNGKDVVIPVFIIDSTLWHSSRVGEKRLAFLIEGLRALDKDLCARGSYLILREGNPEHVLAALIQETGASAIYAEEDYTPYARKRDTRISRTLPLLLVPGFTIHHPDSILKKNGEPYTVFTPYSRSWKSLLIPNFGTPSPARINTPPGIPSLPHADIPSLATSIPFRAGEIEAQRGLASFIKEKIYTYHEQRNRPDLEGTSQLSPYLRFGMISAWQVVSSAQETIMQINGKDSPVGAETWLNELIWREFYQNILFHFPHVSRMSFREKYRSLKWINDPEDFAAWKTGQTGYPIVDAAMRQLRETGWMHNRTRMIVASFLTKHLLVDWRLGEAYFMQQLVDGDTAANNGGWQWSAGTGTDAAPYFRIFNPISQGRLFDPDGKFICRWVPELHKVAVQYVYEPWTMPLDVQQWTGCIIGKDYPAPIVDHQWARQRTLQFYKEASS